MSSLKQFLAATCAVAITAGTVTVGNPVAVVSAASTAAPKKVVSTNANFNPEGQPIVKKKETYEIIVQQISTLKAAGEKTPVKETEALTNVAIKWTEVPASTWTEKINILCSADSLPDAVIGGINMARNYSLLAELDGLLDAFAPNVTKFFDSRPDYRPALKAPDGKIHSLPTGDESTHNLIDTQYWVNTEWLKKLSITMPTSTNQFANMLRAFRDKDPNGNGKNDEIPFTFLGSWGYGNTIKNLFGTFGVLESDSHVFVKDNKVIFSAKEQGYYDFLVWMNSLYKEDLIDKESFTMSSDQYNSRGATDAVGAMAGYGATAAGVKNNPVGRYQALPVLKGPSGIQMIGVNNLARTGGFAISKKVKSPEVLVRWYDTINSSMEMALSWGRGEKDFFWRIVEKDGERAPVFINVPEEKYKAKGYTTSAQYRQGESFAGSTPALWSKQIDDKLIYDTGWPFDYKLQAVKDALPFGYNGLPAGMATAQNSERRAVLIVDIDTYLKKFIADSVMNGINEDSWKKHLTTLNALKVDEYTKLCQDYYDSIAIKK